MVSLLVEDCKLRGEEDELGGVVAILLSSSGPVKDTTAKMLASIEKIAMIIHARELELSAVLAAGRSELEFGGDCGWVSRGATRARFSATPSKKRDGRGGARAWYALPTITTIDKAGRVVIPAEVRKRLGLAAGTELEMMIEGFAIRLVRSAAGPELVRRGKRLVIRPRAAEGERTKIDLARLIDEERDRWLKGAPGCACATEATCSAR
jgi:antitoxin PrlF